MGNKLYVGNLAFSVNSTSLTTLFTQFGTVESAKVIMDRDTGRSKGFAFVEMSNPKEATPSTKYDGVNWTRDLNFNTVDITSCVAELVSILALKLSGRAISTTSKIVVWNLIFCATLHVNLTSSPLSP